MLDLATGSRELDRMLDMILEQKTELARLWLEVGVDLLAFVDDLLECGVSFHDPQYRVHTLDGIARAYGGRMCVMVDLMSRGPLVSQHKGRHTYD